MGETTTDSLDSKNFRLESSSSSRLSAVEEARLEELRSRYPLPKVSLKNEEISGQDDLEISLLNKTFLGEDIPDHYLCSVSFEENYELSLEEAEFLRERLLKRRKLQQVASETDRAAVAISNILPSNATRKSKQEWSNADLSFLGALKKKSGSRSVLAEEGDETSSKETHMMKATNINLMLGDIWYRSAPIFDSGATDCSTPERSILKNYREIDEKKGLKMLLGGREDMSLPIVGVGTAGPLLEVLHVPGMPRTIISIPKLMGWKYTVIFSMTRCFVFEQMEPFKLVMSGTLNRKTNLIHMDQSTSGPTLLEYFESQKIQTARTTTQVVQLHPSQKELLVQR
jgi:hypothetical protein